MSGGLLSYMQELYSNRIPNFIRNSESVDGQVPAEQGACPARGAGFPNVFPCRIRKVIGFQISSEIRNT